jgi:hypothetical protein
VRERERVCVLRLQASRNHTLINIIDAVLAANPHLKRDAEDLAALDARDTVSSWERQSKRPRLGGRRASDSEEEQDDESEEDDEEEEEGEDEDEDVEEEEEEEEEEDVAFAFGAPPEGQGTPGYIVWVSICFQ